MTGTTRTRESDSRTALENQVEAYKRDGFIIIEDVLQGGELSRARPPSTGPRRSPDSTGNRAGPWAEGFRRTASTTPPAPSTGGSTSTSIPFTCSRSCTACVPGSHLWDREPDHLLYKGMGGGAAQGTKVRDQREMPGMVAAEVKAGSDTDDRMFKGVRPERLGEPVR